MNGFAISLLKFLFFHQALWCMRVTEQDGFARHSLMGKKIQFPAFLLTSMMFFRQIPKSFLF